MNNGCVFDSNILTSDSLVPAFVFGRGSQSINASAPNPPEADKHLNEPKDIYGINGNESVAPPAWAFSVLAGMSREMVFEAISENQKNN